MHRFDWRTRLLVRTFALAWIVLAGRLVYLQGTARSELAGRAGRQRTFVETIPARPGEIVDRHGRLLATSITCRSLWIDPGRLHETEAVCRRLANALSLDADELLQRFSASRDRHFLWVKRRLSDAEAAAVRSLDLPPDVWGFREEFLRRYPQGRVAAHVLGLRDIDNAGRGGIEQAFDALLRGRDGRRVLVRDARGRVIDVKDELSRPPEPGRTVVLSIDSVVQVFAERELDTVMESWKPRSACVTVLDPKTCEVLAMASRPTFDPNDPADVPQAAWKNTNLAAIYEPGSTFKPFVVAWALQQGVVEPGETFNCENGAYRMGRRVLHDHHPYGELSVEDILVKSSNIGMAKIGERLTNAGIFEAALAFGFGRETGCGLPGELPGLVRPLRQWNSYSTGSVPMGQEIAATPLQLITAHAALANGGRLISPRLVLRTAETPRLAQKRFQDRRAREGEAPAEPVFQSSPVALRPEARVAESYFAHPARREPRPPDAMSPPYKGGEYGSQVVTPAVRSEIARWLVEGPMTEVVRRGTGKKARLDDYVVFGKTGTAQKPDPTTGRYSSKLHVSSFVCGAPADDPRVLVLVVVDEPSVGTNHYGGTIAAPHAAGVLHKTLVHLRVPTTGDPLRAARSTE